jgi:hypothetical protein
MTGPVRDLPSSQELTSARSGGAAVSQLRLVVVGTLASIPYAGMTWMTMQIVAGLRKLGHDAYYFETTP